MYLLYYYRKRLARTPAATVCGRSAALRRTIGGRGRRAAAEWLVTRRRPLPRRPRHPAARVGRWSSNRRVDPSATGNAHGRRRSVRLLNGRGDRVDVADAADHGPPPPEPAAQRRCLNVLPRNDMPKSVANKAFYLAATQNNTILMNKLLNRGADIDYEDPTTGSTALLAAMKCKYVKATQFLLEKGADPRVRDLLRWTCLHMAVYHEHPYRTLATILAKCAPESIDFRTDDGETALHLAAKTDNETAAYALMRAGAAADALDCRSRTPLLTALHWRRHAVARLMVTCGVLVDRVPGSVQAPLYAAVARNDATMVRLLLDHGAVVVDAHNDDLDRTVIHLACERGDADTLKQLLAHAAPGVLRTLHLAGRPPVVVAARGGHGAAVAALLAAGADVNARSAADGETALHAAVRANNAALVDRLLDAGALLDAAAGAGHRPLDVSVYAWGRRVAITAHLMHSHRLAKAVARHDVDAVRFLLQCGVSPNATTAAHGSPLHAAVRHRRYRMAATILASARCRIDVRHGHVTPLDHATAAGDARASRMLLWHDLSRRGRRTRHASLTWPSDNGDDQEVRRDRRERIRKQSPDTKRRSTSV